MDSGALLDLLGNRNRRRILRLLAQKPCYVTEISEHLGVSPKAVIDHLRKLEEADLVNSRTDNHRRKYFYIANNVRLEVNVSQYGYGAKSAYPASSTLDLGSCQHLSVNVDRLRSDGDGDGEDIAALAEELRELEQLENELSLAQRYVQGCLIEAIEQIVNRLQADTEVDEILNGRIFFEVLVAIATGHHTISEIREIVDVPEPVLENTLERFREHELLEECDGKWQISNRGPVAD